MSRWVIADVRYMLYLCGARAAGASSKGDGGAEGKRAAMTGGALRGGSPERREERKRTGRGEHRAGQWEPTERGLGGGYEKSPRGAWKKGHRRTRGERRM